MHAQTFVYMAAFLALSISLPAFAQETCRASAQTASNAAQKYRNAVGKASTSCSKSSGDCANRLSHADAMFEALGTANDVMQTICGATGGGGGGGGGGTGVTPAAGELVISEIMQDSLAADPEGEWFEIYNPTGNTLDLNGLTVTNQSGQSITVTTSLIVPPFAYAVFGHLANATALLDMGYSGFTLANGGGTITISHGAIVIDTVTFGPATPGKSRQLAVSRLDASSNDSMDNWCLATVTYDLPGNQGTPGEANDGCVL